MGELLLETRQVHFAYAQSVLDGVDLRLHSGEMLGVVGPNGAGKTTLLRLLYGRLTPQRGEVLLFGRQLMSRIGRRERARAISVVRQDTVIGLPITVSDFIMQGRYPYLAGFGFESARDTEIVTRALRHTTLEHLAHRFVDEISGGERQRVLLARALVQEPRILLLDEPTANLDIKYQLETFSLVQRVTRLLNMGTLIITHDLNPICEYADRLIFLKEGRVVCAGAPADVVTRENIQRVFDVDVLVDCNPVTGRPRVSHT